MDKPNIGDLKQCTKCGEEKARYGRCDEYDADAHREVTSGEQPGDRYAWSCDACGFEDRVPP